LKAVSKNVVNSTRLDFKAFNVEEQKRIILIGICSEYQKDNSKVM
jgi:hypothetical protein